MLRNLAQTRGKEETGLKGKIVDSKNSDNELIEETYEKLIKNKYHGKNRFWRSN